MKNRSLRLELVGLGPEERRMRALAEALGIEDRIVFRGYLALEELASAYREAEIFLLPSLSESFSMALLEGMASGLPVVATQVGGIPELVEDGENGLLVPRGDPESLAAALDRLAESPELRARLGANNRRKIERGYGWPSIVGRYVRQFYAVDGIAGHELR